MRRGYRFSICLFRFLLLIEELIRSARTFLGQVSPISESKLNNAFVKVLNRIVAVLVKANPSRENNYNRFYGDVKGFYYANH